MFSLGLIIFEIYYRMKSEMEKYKVLTDLRNTCTFPKDFDKECGGDSLQVNYKLFLFIKTIL